MANKINEVEVASTAPVADVNSVTRIPFGSEFRGGVMISDYDIRIDGSFYGTIITKAKLILGEKSVVKGDVICLNADIYGAMEGNITVGEVLSFKSSCAYKGAIKVQRFSVECGARFDGTSQIISKDEYAKIATQMADQCNKEFPPMMSDDKKKGDKVNVNFTAEGSHAAV